MTATALRKPFLPNERLRANGQPLIRAAVAHAISFITKEPTDRVIRQRWPADRDTEWLVKGAVSQTTTAAAAGLQVTAVPDFFVSMAPQSAGAELLNSGLMLSFNGAAALSVPGVVASAGNAGFVGEMQPIPHRQLPITAGKLEPRKFATLTSFSKETFEWSLPSIESVVRTVLTESVGLALDAAMFSTTVGNAMRPPGLLVGIAALTPSANADHNQACIEDASTLAGSVSAVASNGPIVFVCAPEEAVALRLRTLLFPYAVLASSALPNKTVICVAPNALASATDPAPRFDIDDRDSALHTDDAPSDISTSGSPPVVAYPLISIFQSDKVALRLIFEMAWALRSASGLAWMRNVLW